MLGGKEVRIKESWFLPSERIRGRTQQIEMVDNGRGDVELEQKEELVVRQTDAVVDPVAVVVVAVDRGESGQENAVWRAKGGKAINFQKEPTKLSGG